MTAPPFRPRAPWIVLGGLTAVQVGIGVWRAGVMLRDGLAAGVRPLGWSAGLGADLALCATLALVAWWWLPAGPELPAHRRAAAWALRFLVLAWTLALGHFAWALATGGGALAPWLTWPILALAAALGTWIRRPSGAAPAELSPRPSGSPSPALWIAAAFFLAEVPHLVFPYHFMDAKEIWACRAFAFAQRGSLTGVFDCLDPGRPPLHSVLLWLGSGDPTFQGRLLPFLLFGAFVLLFYDLARRVAPRLAPWALVWLLATDQVFKGQVSAYAGVPLMLAIGAAIAVATDDGALAGRRALAVMMGVVAGAAVALVRRDGLPEFVAALAVLMWVARPRGGGWPDARLWAPLSGAVAGVLSWMLRPAALHVPAVFAPSLATHWTVATAAQAMARLAYGAQGQVFSHYGYGAFAWAWLIVTIWARRAVPGPSPEARRFGLAGIAGWGTTLALYAGLTFLGQPQMSTLFIIRTGFGRHLVHFFPFCLLHATATAERLLRRAGS
jgi:hypothetical protein